MIESIHIKLGSGVTVELSLQDARELHRELTSMFGNGEPHVPASPYVPQLVPTWPWRPADTWPSITLCSTAEQAPVQAPNIN